jgi:hypothetical protein
MYRKKIKHISRIFKVWTMRLRITYLKLVLHQYTFQVYSRRRRNSLSLLYHKRAHCVCFFTHVNMQCITWIFSSRSNAYLHSQPLYKREHMLHNQYHSTVPNMGVYSLRLCKWYFQCNVLNHLAAHHIGWYFQSLGLSKLGSHCSPHFVPTRRKRIGTPPRSPKVHASVCVLHSSNIDVLPPFGIIMPMRI